MANKFFILGDAGMDKDELNERLAHELQVGPIAVMQAEVDRLRVRNEELEEALKVAASYMLHGVNYVPRHVPADPELNDHDFVHMVLNSRPLPE